MWCNLSEKVLENMFLSLIFYKDHFSIPQPLPTIMVLVIYGFCSNSVHILLFN